MTLNFWLASLHLTGAEITSTHHCARVLRSAGAQALGFVLVKGALRQLSHVSKPQVLPRITIVK